MRKVLKPSDIARAYDIRKREDGWHDIHECDETCFMCKYVQGTKDNRGEGLRYDRLCCDYIGITGHARMCPAGWLCNKFEKGDGINDSSAVGYDVGRKG